VTKKVFARLETEIEAIKEDWLNGKFPDEKDKEFRRGFAAGIRYVMRMDWT